MEYFLTTFTLTAAPDTAAELIETASDLVCALAGEAGYEAFEQQQGRVLAYVQRALYSEEALQTALASWPMDGITLTHHTAPAPDEDWNAAWERAGFEPIDVAGTFFIYDARHPVSVPPARTAIALAPRQAFGTGTHQTTRLMLAALARADVAGKDVLDCGCGTGVLAIAAALSGAASVVAYDIDPWSADNARDNAALNHATHIEVRLGDSGVIAQDTACYDLVMANINRNILLSDLPRMARALRPGGRLLLSGFYLPDADMLAEAAAVLGLHQRARNTEGEWACVELMK